VTTSARSLVTPRLPRLLVAPDALPMPAAETEQSGYARMHRGAG
jgi:hypothetical protein